MSDSHRKEILARGQQNVLQEIKPNVTAVSAVGRPTGLPRLSAYLTGVGETLEIPI